MNIDINEKVGHIQCFGKDTSEYSTVNDTKCIEGEALWDAKCVSSVR